MKTILNKTAIALTLIASNPTQAQESNDPPTQEVSTTQQDTNTRIIDACGPHGEYEASHGHCHCDRGYTEVEGTCQPNNQNSPE